MKKALKSERLIELRKKNNYSGAELGKRTNLTQGFISALERGTKAPSLETLGILANALNTTIGYLMGETDDPSYTRSLDTGIARVEPSKEEAPIIKGEGSVSGNNLVFEDKGARVVLPATPEGYVLLRELLTKAGRINVYNDGQDEKPQSDGAAKSA
jgi:transcriptional regulator with XRE-family HTH domain